MSAISVIGIDEFFNVARKIADYFPWVVISPVEPIESLIVDKTLTFYKLLILI